MAPFDAVLVISFGGPQGPHDIRPFLANVLRGRRVSAARAELRAHGADVDVTFVESWFDHPGFIHANAAHVRDARARLAPAVRDAARLVCTAHSIPEPMARRSRYEAQLRQSSRLVAEA